jgi:riboflavin synthase
VNLECDMIGKYIENFMKFDNKAGSKSEINMEFLARNGFL